MTMTMVCGAEDRAVVGDQSAAVVRVFDMLIERLGRMEDGLGRLGAYMGRLGAYMGQRAEELPAGSEVGAELELELEQEQELELELGGQERGGPSESVRLLKCYDGRFQRPSDLFMVETPSMVRPSAADLGVPEVIALGAHMLVDLSRGAEAERRLPPLRQLLGVVRRAAGRLGAAGAPPRVLEVHVLPAYAQEVARKLVEEGDDAATLECMGTNSGDASRFLVRFYCKTVCAESATARFPHPLSDVWPEAT